MNFYFDITRWALPVLIDWSKSRAEIDLLCFAWVFHSDTVEIVTPEQELKELNEYAEEQLNWIAEEREEINKRMGIQTR